MAASDFQLLDRYAAGDESAFEELVLRHQKTVYDLAYRMLENHADAADLAQKSFVQAFLHHRSFKRESSFRTWLYQICLNQCRNALRDRARRVHEDVEELALAAPQDTFAEVAKAELKDRLGQGVRTLPARQREALGVRGLPCRDGGGPPGPRPGEGDGGAGPGRPVLEGISTQGPP